MGENIGARGTLRRWLVASALMLGVTGALFLLQLSTAAAASQAPVLPILVLGDSYSAGNGAGDYYGPKGCRRSRRNYAEDYARLIALPPHRQKASVTNAARSGATTASFFSGSSAQIRAVNHSYDLILLTVGGNDVYFGDMVKFCLIARFRDGAHCRQDLDRALTLLQDGTVKRAILQVLGAVEGADPRAKIVLFGYPYLEAHRSYRLTDRREGQHSFAGDPCVERRGAANVVTVGRCFYRIEDLGESIQRAAVELRGAAPGTQPFVFVSTKRLFEGPPNHELFAKRNNPNRWFIQPFIDAPLTENDIFYTPTRPARSRKPGCCCETEAFRNTPSAPHHPPHEWRSSPGSDGEQRRFTRSHGIRPADAPAASPTRTSMWTATRSSSC